MSRGPIPCDLNFTRGAEQALRFVSAIPVLIFGEPNDQAGDPFIVKILVRFRYITSMSRPSKVKEGDTNDSVSHNVYRRKRFGSNARSFG
jgi:hypothetical protein